MREREKQRDTTDRQTEKESDRQTGRKKYRQIERHTGGQR